MVAAVKSWPAWAFGAAAALGAIAIALPLLPPEQVAASAALAGGMGVVAAEDYRTFRVPDGLNAAIAIAGLALAGASAWRDGTEPSTALLFTLLQMALCGGALLLVREAFFRLRGVDGLGLGDVKLGAAAGAWITAEDFALAVMLAAIGALVFVAVQHRRQGAWAAERRIPFAVYFAPAIWACWFLRQLAPAG